MESLSSPFAAACNAKYLLSGVIHSGDAEDGLSLPQLLKWLCTTPKYSSFRVNTLCCDAKDVLQEIQVEVERVSDKFRRKAPKVEVHPIYKDVILVHNWDIPPKDLVLKEKEVIVDVRCGEAILRGAHIFAPGILGMPSGTKVGDEVSIFVDMDGKCKKGLLKPFEGLKQFVGNGIVKMDRFQLFKTEVLNGIAIEVISTKSGCLPIGNASINPNKAILQNLPSIICTYILNPQPGEMILDMCASPGNKTTHIAALMQNKGTIIALDNTPNKLKQLHATCEAFEANVLTFQADSTKILSANCKNDIFSGPPFLDGTFDRILLDAPCSALGKRPQLRNNSTRAVLESHIPLQRKLFETAVKLLKTNGTLVYSTCSIAVAENEAIVAWALHKFLCLNLKTCEPHQGGIGLQCSGISREDCQKLRRFGYADSTDSIGFFIACFTKNKRVV